jgi:hypothetical protein
MEATPLQWVSAAIFAAALIHTLATKPLERMARRFPRHAGAFRLLGEVEVVFGFWAGVLIVAMALMAGSDAAIGYIESRQFDEPLFVFAVMIVAASRPVLALISSLTELLARCLPLRPALAHVWLGFSVVPLFGSLITEPAAMTLAALMLRRRVFRHGPPEWLKYAALGVLFVNVSIGGTLTSWAAPPVLMVTDAWRWDSRFMLVTFGWKAALAVFLNATVITALLRRCIEADGAEGATSRVPGGVQLVHLAFLAGVVVFAHHPVIFLGLFLFFMGFTHAYERHQSPLVLKEGLLVGFFLAGLVVLGGMQQWWLQPLVSSLGPQSLFAAALGLTSITDNAALTYLGSLIEGLSPQARYMLVAGAVAGGGLTVIANAPNPAGVSLLRRGFNDESIGALGLLAGAALPTAVAAAAFLLL